MTRTKNKTATQTQVIALAVLGVAAAAAFGYIGYSLPKRAISPIPPSTQLSSPLVPPGYNPGGYQPPGYNPPGYNPPGYSMVGKPGAAKVSCSYAGWDVTPSVTPISNVAKSSVIKGTNTTLYWYGADGKRYVFPNEKTYRTWYPYGVCPTITKVSDQDLAKLTIAGTVTYRPGTRLLKIVTDPTVYAVSKGGFVHQISPTDLEALYGQNWWSRLDDISDGFFVNYTIGMPATQQNFNPAGETASAPTIDIDKGL